MSAGVPAMAGDAIARKIAPRIVLSIIKASSDYGFVSWVVNLCITLELLPIGSGAAIRRRRRWPVLAIFPPPELLRIEGVRCGRPVSGGTVGGVLGGGTFGGESIDAS